MSKEDGWLTVRRARKGPSLDSVPVGQIFHGMTVPEQTPHQTGAQWVDDRAPPLVALIAVATGGLRILLGFGA